MSNLRDRYHRQKLIPNWDQSKILKSNVLILGVGALGSYVATNLTLSGVGKIILVDYDTIELSNLNRQLLYTPDDLGKNKAIVAKEKLQLLNPDIEIIAFDQAMEKIPNNLIENCTIIATCLDTFQGRRWANSLAIREKLPMITGGMYGFMGQVQTILPFKTACFECQPLISQEKLSQACSPLGIERKEKKEKKLEAPIPSVATVSSIIAGMISQELIKYILDVGQLLDNYMFFDGLSNSFTSLHLKRNDSCPICGIKYRLNTATAISFKGELVKDFKIRIAHAFGMANPSIMVKGKFLVDNDVLNVDESDKLFVIDERLASPIALNIKYESD